MGHHNILNIVVIWRGKHLNIELDQNSMVEELGNKLQKVTNVKPSTMRLLIPHPNRTSKLLTPFSDDHSHLSLQETAIIEGKPIRMLGVLADEIEEVSHNSTKADLRIAGFDEEEKRLRQRLGDTPSASLKLPQGSYIFCDFQTLQISGIKLDPPPSEALRRMHMLACDPGIVAIMNKHRWRVGVMTEMAPVGYVGISPKCILGFNKNHGEEISLRLRTDDLKGFRKYESIKKTLLHELAHMVYSEHDASFFALDKQLNQEAASLDWTKSKSHTLSGRKFSHQYGDNTHMEETTYIGQKLGGARNLMATARASSVAAAYQRFLNASEGFQVQAPVEGLDTNGITEKTNNHPLDGEQLPDAAKEPDPDEAVIVDVILGNPYSMIDDAQHIPDDCLDNGKMFELGHIDSHAKESDPYDSRVGEPVKSFEEPDPDDSILNMVDSNGMDLDPSGGERVEHDTKDHMDELHNLELQRIDESVAAICTRLQDAIKTLKTEATPEEATLVLQTLFKIIRNVIDHPNEIKFKRLRKANPHFQRNVVNYKAAMEVLVVVGFCEDVVYDEVGRAETFMVLKRNDPGLLWLAKSSLEAVA